MVEYSQLTQENKRRINFYLMRLLWNDRPLRYHPEITIYKYLGISERKYGNVIQLGAALSDKQVRKIVDDCSIPEKLLTGDELALSKDEVKLFQDGLERLYTDTTYNRNGQKVGLRKHLSKKEQDRFIEYVRRKEISRSLDNLVSALYGHSKGRNTVTDLTKKLQAGISMTMLSEDTRMDDLKEFILALQENLEKANAAYYYRKHMDKENQS